MLCIAPSYLSLNSGQEFAMLDINRLNVFIGAMPPNQFRTVLQTLTLKP